jgi:hypothetical protein
MGQAKLHALGRNLKYFVTPEATLGTYVALVDPAAGGSTTEGMRVLSSSMEYAQERVDRADARGDTRSLTDRITRRVNCTYSVESYLLPSGTPETVPDADLLFTAVMGAVETGTVDVGSVTGTSGVRYSLTATQAMPSVCLTRETSGVVQQRMRGCYVGEMTITGSGSDEPKVSFSGTGISMTNVGRTLTTNATTDTAVPLTPSTGLQLGDPSATYPIQVDIGSSTNLTVNTVDVTNPLLPLAELSASATWTLGDVIKPYSPALADSGVPINGVSGSVTIGGLPASYASMPITAFDVTVNNNTKALNDEAFTNLMTDFIPGFRSVTGNVTVRANQEQILELNKRRDFGTRSVEMILGDSSSAGNYAVIYMNSCEFGFGALEIPEAEEATFTLPFTALSWVDGAVTTENEIVLGFF